MTLIYLVEWFKVHDTDSAYQSHWFIHRRNRPVLFIERCRTLPYYVPNIRLLNEWQ